MAHHTSRIHIGCAAYGRQRRGLLGRVDLIEVQDTFAVPPKAATLASWRRTAPAGVVFSCRAWQVVTHEAEGPAYQRLPPDAVASPADCGWFRDTEQVRLGYQRTLQCARALEARAVLFTTPASFAPTRVNRTRIERFFGKVERPDNTALVWEAHGVWDAALVLGLSREAGLVACTDPLLAEAPPTAGGTGYFKLAAPSYSERELARVAEVLPEYEEVYVVFCGSRAPFDARHLRQALAQP